MKLANPFANLFENGRLRLKLEAAPLIQTVIGIGYRVSHRRALAIPARPVILSPEHSSALNVAAALISE